MSGDGWIAAYEDGNDGKWFFRATSCRAYYFQSVAWAGWSGEGDPLGVCFRWTHGRITLKAPNTKTLFKVSQTWR